MSRFEGYFCLPSVRSIFSRCTAHWGNLILADGWVSLGDATIAARLCLPIQASKSGNKAVRQHQCKCGISYYCLAADA
jgi:hypothetical protein